MQPLPEQELARLERDIAPICPVIKALVLEVRLARAAKAPGIELTKLVVDRALAAMDAHDAAQREGARMQGVEVLR